jgi:hypothetical protein
VEVKNENECNLNYSRCDSRVCCSLVGVNGFVMPYNIKKQGSKYAIIRKTDGKVVGTSASRLQAAASARIRMASHSKKGK